MGVCSQTGRCKVPEWPYILCICNSDAGRGLPDVKTSDALMAPTGVRQAEHTLVAHQVMLAPN